MKLLMWFGCLLFGHRWLFITLDREGRRRNRCALCDETRAIPCVRHPVPGRSCVYNDHMTRGTDACIWCGEPFHRDAARAALTSETTKGSEA